MVEAKKQSGSFDADLARGELLLLMSADNLKKGIEYAVSQLYVRKVRGADETAVDALVNPSS